MVRRSTHGCGCGVDVVRVGIEERLMELRVGKLAREEPWHQSRRSGFCGCHHLFLGTMEDELDYDSFVSNSAHRGKKTAFSSQMSRLLLDSHCAQLSRGTCTILSDKHQYCSGRIEARMFSIHVYHSTATHLGRYFGRYTDVAMQLFSKLFHVWNRALQLDCQAAYLPCTFA